MKRVLCGLAKWGASFKYMRLRGGASCPSQMKLLRSGWRRVSAAAAGLLECGRDGKVYILARGCMVDEPPPCPLYIHQLYTNRREQLTFAIYEKILLLLLLLGACMRLSYILLTLRRLSLCRLSNQTTNSWPPQAYTCKCSVYNSVRSGGKVFDRKLDFIACRVYSVLYSRSSSSMGINNNNFSSSSSFYTIKLKMSIFFFFVIILMQVRSVGAFNHQNEVFNPKSLSN